MAAGTLAVMQLALQLQSFLQGWQDTLRKMPRAAAMAQVSCSRHSLEMGGKRLASGLQDTSKRAKMGATARCRQPI